jgi:DNA (cytosine-5)-methyltransferase 1
MTLLYPRLLSAQAAQLHDEYRRMEPAALTERAVLQHDSAVYTATGGDRAREKELEQVRKGVLAAARQAGFPGAARASDQAAFDLEIARFLHRESDMAPAEAAAGDVWAFMALVLLPDVAYWRYPRPPIDRVLATDITRHVFGRLWWRAHLVHDPNAEEPYDALGVLGESAFDQIYARRKALGGSPMLVRAILLTWQELDLTGYNERELLRDFLKRLLRLAPFMSFEALDERTLRSELRRTVDEAVQAFANT